MSDIGDTDFSPGDVTPQTVQAPDITPAISISPDDPTFQAPSIMGGVDFSGMDLPVQGSSPAAPPVRQSHTGANLAELNQLPAPYRNALTGRVWVNPTGQGLRGQDGAGNGAFGQSRSDGTQHGGADWINVPGQTVVAPTGGTIGPASSYNGMGAVRIDLGDGSHVDTLYTNPTVKPGDTVSAGDPIGTAADLRPVYGPRMTNHTHVQIKIPAINTVVNPASLIPH